MNNKNKKPVEKRSAMQREPVAIIGMSCRFPQAASCEAFWELMKQGKDSITEITDERWTMADWYDPDPHSPHKTHQRHAAMLDHIDDFDPLFFGISPAEAAEMSPSQKLTLELVWEAMESTRTPLDRVAGKKAGVYVGNIWSDFEHHRKHRRAAVTSHSAVGQASNIIANRVSFTYGFTGPSLVVDTGCSSSLVALHLACQGLWDDSTELAFVVGVNHILDPDQYVLLSKFGGLSRKGKCSTFDAAADGFVRGEGGGVIVLKKLAQAEADGNRILAVIRGSAMNNNGHNASLPATSAEGQKQMLADAYQGSGVSPSEVHYVEAHGTGTRLGDPTEAKALGEFFSAGRIKPLRIGSVKTNIGHLEGAAGMAGLIKVVLAMHHRQLPPSLNFNTPNPDIPFQALKLQVQQQLGDWPAKKHETLKAGINSFGWGGTNAHTVLEEYRPTLEKIGENIPQGHERLFLPLSAQSPAALTEYANAYQKLIENTSPCDVAKICAAAALLKPALEYRMLLAANDKKGLLHALKASTPGETTRAAITGGHKLVMVFPGQGAQWLGMGRNLFQTEPVFRQAIEACHAAFKSYTDWSLVDQFHADQASSLLHQIQVVQPVLFAIQVALARLWMALGVTPHTVVGHSMGEVSAAHIAGVLNLDQAARIICTRSMLMQRVSGKGGAMAVTELSPSQAKTWTTRYPQLSLAVSNSPKSSVLAGDQQTLEHVLAQLEQQNLFARLVKVDVASHSPQMDTLKEDLFSAISDLQPRNATIPICSTVTGKPIEGTAMDANYWVSNLRGTVLFNTAVDKLLRSGHTIFLEVSPHPALVNAVLECADHNDGMSACAIPTLFRDKPEQESLYKNLGELYSRGYTIDWKKTYPGAIPNVDLPAYPFQRERYALEGRANDTTTRGNDTRYPLIGQEFALADAGAMHFWEIQISLEAFPFLEDHQVDNVPVLPGAMYVEMILEACRAHYGRGVPIISHLRFIRSVTLSPKETTTLQLKLRKENKVALVQLFQKTVIKNDDINWELLAEAEVATSAWPEYRQRREQNKYEQEITGAAYYEKLLSLGLQYGDYFRHLKQLAWTAGGSQVFFTVSASERVRLAPQAYQVHPAVLDACLQPVFMQAITEALAQRTSIAFLTEISEIQWLGNIDPCSELHGIASLKPLRHDEQRGFAMAECDLIVYRADNLPAFTVKGLKARIMDSTLVEQRKEKLKSWLYNLTWTKLVSMPSQSHHSTAGADTWLILGDPYGVSGLLLEKLKRQGVSCIHVTPGNRFLKTGDATYTIRYGTGEDYRALFSSIIKDDEKHITGILHAGSLSYTWQDPFLTADVVESLQNYGSISFMYMHQHLAALDLPRLPRLVIVTNGVHTTGEQDEVAQPVHSPLWGMVRVMFNELTQYTCRYVDLSANPSQEELDHLAGAVANWTLNENEVALRGLQVYVPRLGPCPDDGALAPKRSFSPAGTYLITGFRGLGFRFVEWMVRQGARGFALISRSGEISEELRERIDALRERGCRFSIFRADTGNYTEIKNVWDEVESSLPEIKGIVHAAGIIEARTLTDLRADEFLRILNPKVKGAWNLHLLSLKKNLDCFILFSSASTLIGLSGQGSYVAANAFLDALAHCRKRMGLPGMSINWGVIRDVGMVADHATLEKFARAEGFEPVSMPEALDVFQAIYDTLPTQIGIVKWNVDSVASYYTALAQTRYFEGLLKEEKENSPKISNFLTQLASLPTREQKIDAITNLVIRQVANVVKIAPEKITPSTTFKSLGIDSLMAIRLRNLLEKNLRLQPPVGMFWSKPQVGEYAIAIYQNLKISTEEPLVQGNPPSDKVPALLITQPNPMAAARLFCFHDAGGSASLYLGWDEYLGETIELIAVELPGRGAGQLDRPYTRMAPLLEDLMAQITPLLDKPFAFFGHSMGGMLAFELAHELRRRSKAMPSALFISSTPGLSTYAADQINPLLSNDALSKAFPHLDKKAIGDEKLFHRLLHVLRADLTLINNYSYTPKAPLSIPFIILYGRDDTRVSPGQAKAWQSETLGICKIIARPGGHRYLAADVSFVTACIKNQLTTAQPEYERIH